MPPQTEKYVWKEIPGSSHDVIRRWIRTLPPGMRLLDLGAAGGHLGRAVRDRCAFVAGVEPVEDLPGSAKTGYDDWRTTAAETAGDWPEPFDVVVCADVLEHLARPDDLLERIRSWLKPNGVLLASIPNVANISVRASLLAGRFSYAERGILDRTHLRFYTFSTARRLLENGRFWIRRAQPTAMPYELAFSSLGRGPLTPLVRRFAVASARLWPTLFGYQFVFEGVRAPETR